MPERRGRRPVTFRRSGVEVTPEPIERDPFLDPGNRNDAQEHGAKDGRVRIPSTPTHPRYVWRLAEAAEAAVESIAGRRAEVDKTYAARQHEECQTLSGAQLNPSMSARALAQIVGILSGFVAAAIVYVTLDELATWMRAVLATAFGAAFPIVAAWRALLADVRDALSGLSAGLVFISSFIMAIDIRSPFPWAMSRITTTGAALGILTTSWFVVVIVADAYPPLYRLAGEKRRRDSLEAYRKLTELREAAWITHSRQIDEVSKFARELMDLYYAANLRARRNSGSAQVEPIAAMERPNISVPAWVTAPPPNFDFCALPADPFTVEEPGPDRRSSD